MDYYFFIWLRVNNFFNLKKIKILIVSNYSLVLFRYKNYLFNI